MNILSIKLEQVGNFIEEGQLRHLTQPEVNGGKVYEKGYIIRTDSIMQGVPQYDMYNQFMIIAQHKGFNCVFFNH